jgi:hypothetical protein
MKLRWLIILSLVSWASYEAGWQGYSNHLDKLIAEQDATASAASAGGLSYPVLLEKWSRERPPPLPGQRAGVV